MLLSSRRYVVKKDGNEIKQTVTNSSVYVCTHTHMSHIEIQCVCVRNTYTYTGINTYIHICMYVCICICICICVHDIQDCIHHNLSLLFSRMNKAPNFNSIVNGQIWRLLHTTFISSASFPLFPIQRSNCSAITCVTTILELCIF